MAVAERIITIGDQRIDGVWFTRRDPIASLYRAYDTGREDLVHLATDDVSRTPHIRDRLLQTIDNAKEKLFFASYLFADEHIVEALCRAAERLRGGVYVLTALDNHLKPERDVDADSDTLRVERAQRHAVHLRRLAVAGAWLRSSEDCHAKFCVADDSLAVVTSANATQVAYESNPEDAFVASEPLIARELGRLFSFVWLHLTTLESIPGAELDVRSARVSKPPAWRKLQRKGPLAAVATVREHESSLRTAAIEVIDGAKQHLAIATFSLAGIERHPIGEALRRALARGVRIDLVLRPRNHVLGQRQACSWLKRLAPDRVHLHGHARTHTKSIVADQRDVLLWTGNLEAAHGWENGIEVGIRAKDSGCARAVASWTRDVMDRSTLAGIDAPTVNELVQDGAPGAFGGTWELQIPARLSVSRVVAHLTKGPVEAVRHSGGRAFRCSGDAIEIDVDEVAREVVAKRIVRADRIIRAESNGWVSNCTMRISTKR